jgi:ABC-2 type transport system permease protein
MMWHYLKLIALFARVSFQDDAAYRMDFLVRILMSVVQLGAELLGVWTIFSNTKSLAGWNAWQMVALLGVFRIMTGVIAAMIAPNMRLLMEEIRDGKLDYAILKPINTQFMISLRKYVLWRLTDVALGLALVIFACVQLSATLTPWMIFRFLVMLAAGVTIIYSFWLILGTCAFWLTRISNIEMVFWSLFEAGRYPVSIYPPWLRYGLTFIVPLAFLTTFPAGVLVGKGGLVSVTVAVIVAGCSLLRLWESCARRRG